MSDPRATIAAGYRGDLEAYLANGGEPVRKRAYETGRRALEGGLGLLELAEIHHVAVAAVLEGSRSVEEASASLRGAAAFFAEVACPYEMTHRAFRDANVALRRINERLEAEARRIAHALHDDAGPLLVAVQFALKDLAVDAPETLRSRIDVVRGHVGAAEERIRHLAREMRPTFLDDLGLAESIRFLAQGILTRRGLRIEVEDRLRNRLRPPIETSIYRIVQEALTNVARHAQAENARVRLTEEADRVRCSIWDDGIGFRPASAKPAGEPQGLGLLGIRERVDALGGSLRIASTPGRGTELQVVIPLEE